MKYQLVFAAIGGRLHNTKKNFTPVLVRAPGVLPVPGAFAASGDEALQ